MIRRRATSTELNLDSLTDTMTNTMGLILLLVVGTVMVSGGMKIVLMGQMQDPRGRIPIYVVCKDSRVYYMYHGNDWKLELARVCGDLESRLGRKPSTSETLLETNKLGLCHTADYRAMFVREVTYEHGQALHVIGIRFLQRESASNSGGAELFSEAASQALSQADPERDYIYAFVYETGADALKALEGYAKQHNIEYGWRPIKEMQNPGLSDSGLPGWIGSGGGK